MHESKYLDAIKYTFEVGLGEPEPDDGSKKLSHIDGRFSAAYKRPEEAVHGLYSIEEFVDFMNCIDRKVPKSSGENTFLSGLYSGGISAMHNYKPTDVVPIDIDIKRKEKDGRDENLWLMDISTVGRVIKELEPYVYVLGNTGGGGLMGLIRVKGIDVYQSGKLGEFLRLECSKAVYSFFEKKIRKELDDPNIIVKFDYTQGKFRQNRLVYQQNKKAVYNPAPIPFVFKEIQSPKMIEGTRIVAKKSLDDGYSYSMYSDFDRDNAHLSHKFLLGLGMIHENGDRYRHPNSSSGNGIKLHPDGSISSFSGTALSELGNLKCWQLAKRYYGLSSKEFSEKLRKEGYRNKEVNTKEIVRRLQKGVSHDELVDISDKLKNHDYKTRYGIFKQVTGDPTYMLQVRYYLGVKNLRIPYDEHIPLEGRVSDLMPLIYKRLEEHKKLILWSPTSSGKTYGIFNWVINQSEGARVLLISPLMGIADGAGRGYFPEDNITRVTGSRKDEDYKRMYETPIVTCTYNHAAEILKHRRNIFDIIVFDEVHTLIKSNSYREPVLKDVQMALNKYMTYYPDLLMLGLSGTPLRIFKDLGFYTIKLLKEENPVHFKAQRHTYDAFLWGKQVISEHGGTGKKMLLRMMSTKAPFQLKKWVEENGIYHGDNIIALTGDSKLVGEGKVTYDNLMRDGKLPDNVELVLLSPVLDEGINIDNDDFSEVHFFEQGSEPQPESFKQFIARLRHPMPDMKVYLYLKVWKENGFHNDKGSFVNESEYIREEMDTISGESYLSPVGSFDPYILERGKLNEFKLAQVVSDGWYRSLSTLELFEYMNVNFGFTYNINSEYEQVKIDHISNKKVSWSDRSFSDMFRDHLEEIKVAIVPHLTRHEKNRLFGLELNNMDILDVDEGIINFVGANRDNVVEVLKYLSAFTKIAEQPRCLLDPERALFDKKGRLRKQASFKVMKEFLDLQSTLQIPHFNDRRKKDKYSKFIALCQNHNGGSMNNGDIQRYWVNARLYRHALKPNNKRDTSKMKAVKAFINSNTDWNYNYKHKKLVKDDAYVSEWLKEWLCPLEIEEKVVVREDTYVRYGTGLLNVKSGQLEMLFPQ